MEKHLVVPYLRVKWSGNAHSGGFKSVKAQWANTFEEVLVVTRQCIQDHLTFPHYVVFYGVFSVIRSI